MNIDLSLSRNFKVRERGTITFRAEAFNLTNSTMYGFASTSLEQLEFRTPRSARLKAPLPGNATTARVMQFAIKYAF
jgi:hypothetical protein